MTLTEFATNRLHLKHFPWEFGQRHQNSGVVIVLAHVEETFSHATGGNAAFPGGALRARNCGPVESHGNPVHISPDDCQYLGS